MVSSLIVLFMAAAANGNTDVCSWHVVMLPSTEVRLKSQIFFTGISPDYSEVHFWQTQWSFLVISKPKIGYFGKIEQHTEPTMVIASFRFVPTTDCFWRTQTFVIKGDFILFLLSLNVMDLAASQMAICYSDRWDIVNHLDSDHTQGCA